ncbi:bifunctional UDP-N-acetylglucosamine pyrophosphorylase/glucosamine-1-phosphate N-acetyltransferase [Anaerosolibacter carboniphilus]|uniref:Bifunctional protein GlmU n=1 Tax=Anaerosolibacter carboniphilus TaxID=1417629 RepID=A0A841KXJ2_9FIRM|nr:bifunctional UDP-N-acetylglucosamine diphosphorylase/glucosamine-1-phosphate N-acetyltransferase GlmU [Anaerosolibacter carboniphilus]MBB6218456.1 bifunctional UDP-N-acetylglucosamine pyrophosphorylase/glucosamine-1-phosphate N-acetyltransferase [Anaerosolibacter carboniphilus]
MGKMTAVILAAGAGTRMKSKLPKVIHEVSSKPMVEHVIDVAEENGVDRTIVVIGHGGELVEKAIDHRNVQFVWQREQLGTGHAVMQAADYLEDEGDVLLLYGDTPLIRTETIQELIQYHRQGNYAATVLTAQFEDPTGYGRIVRGQNGFVERIVEQKDASEDEKRIQEINSGMYCYNGKLLKEALKKLTNDNVQKEYYITDVVEILNQEGHRVGAYTVSDKTEIAGVNSRVQLAEAEAVMRERVLKELMENGVTMIDPQHVYVDKGVKVGRDTILYPGVILKGKTEIGEGCIIGHNSRIIDSVIRNDVEIQSSTIVESFVDDACQIGPYAYLRPNSRLGQHVKIGDFVEVKNSTIGDYSKASHLAYVGDGEVGKHVNIGCGVVFVNYDGKQKHKSIVEDHAFVGSNVNLVAPVTVRKYGYIATGSTITKEVPEGALSVARAKQENKLGWVARKGLMK